MENEEKQVIRTSEVISMLENGKTREEIGAHYDLNGVQVKALFEHPTLKGRKTKKPLPFVIEDDLNQQEENNENTDNNSGTNSDTNTDMSPAAHSDQNADTGTEEVLEQVEEEVNQTL